MLGVLFLHTQSPQNPELRLGVLFLNSVDLTNLSWRSAMVTRAIAASYLILY